MRFWIADSTIDWPWSCETWVNHRCRGTIGELSISSFICRIGSVSHAKTDGLTDPNARLPTPRFGVLILRLLARIARELLVESSQPFQA